MIGFNPAEYMIREDGGEIAFMVRLINGTLTKPVVVEFFTTDGTAGGEIKCMTLCIVHEFILHSFENNIML